MKRSLRGRSLQTLPVWKPACCLRRCSMYPVRPSTAWPFIETKSSTTTTEAKFLQLRRRSRRALDGAPSSLSRTRIVTFVCEARVCLSTVEPTRLAMRPNSDFRAPPGAMEILDLRHFSSSDLRPLMEDEVRAWSRLLSWDYTGSAEMILRY